MMEEQATQLSDRAKKAASIAQEPEKYKICEGCDSIVTANAATCPNCFSYRFENDSQRVIEQAILLGQREQQSVLASDLE